MSTMIPPMNTGLRPAYPPHRAAMVLTLGILGLVVCGICAIIALVMGKNDLRAIDNGQMDPTGRGMTQAGWICGIIGTVFFSIQLLVAIVYIVIVVFVIGGLGLAAAGAASGQGRGAGGTSGSGSPTSSGSATPAPRNTR